MEIKIREQQIIESAAKGMDDFVQLFTDSIADAVGGAAALAWGLAATGKSMDELRVVTVNGNLNYLRPARGTCIYAEARYRKMGRTMAVIDLSLTDDQGEEVCSGTFTFMYVQFQRYQTK